MRAGHFVSSLVRLSVLPSTWTEMLIAVNAGRRSTLSSVALHNHWLCLIRARSPRFSFNPVWLPRNPHPLISWTKLLQFFGGGGGVWGGFKQTDSNSEETWYSAPALERQSPNRASSCASMYQNPSVCARVFECVRSRSPPPPQESH